MKREDLAIQIRKELGPFNCRWLPLTTCVANAVQYGQENTTTCRRLATSYDDELGWFLSAALEDENVCDEVKKKIEAWFNYLDWSMARAEGEECGTDQTGIKDRDRG